MLRALRLLRRFKLSRYSPAMHTLLRVLANEKRLLTGAGLLLTVVLLFSSTGIYLIEGKNQPDKFGNVPAAAYWAMTTLTTAGYGDVSPITPLGKIRAMLTILFGLCVLALPLAIISRGFAQEAGRRDLFVTWSLMPHIRKVAADAVPNTNCSMWHKSSRRRIRLEPRPEGCQSWSGSAASARRYSRNQLCGERSWIENFGKPD